MLKAQVPDVSMRPPLWTDADDLLRCSATVGNLGASILSMNPNCICAQKRVGCGLKCYISLSIYDLDEHFVSLV